MIADPNDGREGEPETSPFLDGDDDDGDRAENSALLGFGDDEQLPWLESDDDLEDEGPDTGRIVGFAIAGLIALAAIVGGIWWATHNAADPELVADGSTIAAPDAPYKVKPDAPGGKTFEGTGDASFKVGEGKTAEGQVAAVPAPRPSIDAGLAPAKPAPVPAPASAPATSAPAPKAEPAAGGVAVQVGAYSTREQAEAGWNLLVSRHDALQGVSHRVVEGRADIGTVYRLQAVPGSAAAANALCGRLKADGAACQVKR